MNADRPGSPLACTGDVDCFCDVCREGRGAGQSYLDSTSETSGHQTLTLYYARCGSKHVVKLRCGDRTCPTCREKDFWRFMKGYEESIQAIKGPKLLTLTLRNVETLTRGQIRRLRSSFTKLLHRKRWKRIIHGGLQTVEITNKGKGWHIHMHCMVDADYIPWEKLRADWLKITGDSFIVDVREAGTVVEGLKYCLKSLLSKLARVEC